MRSWVQASCRVGPSWGCSGISDPPRGTSALLQLRRASAGAGGCIAGLPVHPDAAVIGNTRLQGDVLAGKPCRYMTLPAQRWRRFQGAELSYRELGWGLPARCTRAAPVLPGLAAFESSSIFFRRCPARESVVALGTGLQSPSIFGPFLHLFSNPRLNSPPSLQFPYRALLPLPDHQPPVAVALYSIPVSSFFSLYTCIIFVTTIVLLRRGSSHHNVWRSCQSPAACPA